MKTKIIASVFLLIVFCFRLSIAQLSPGVIPFEKSKSLWEHYERINNTFNKLQIDKYTHSYQKYPNNDPLGLTAIIADFQVNENAGPNGASNECASVSTDAEGNFVITWVDDRNGIPSDIFAQRYLSDGTPLGANFEINDDEGIISILSEPSISVEGSGNFVIIWKDNRNDYLGDIYAQRYSNDGTPVGVNFKVNDDQGNAWQTAHSISSDYNGNFVITWQDFRNGEEQPDIYAQRYSNDGTPLGANFKVNDDVGGAWQERPSICSDSTGNFVITWLDPRNGDSDVYAQRYLSDGTPVGVNFKVNDDQGNAEQFYPSISADKNGNFVITWSDNRGGNWNIYAQRYFSDGTPVGVNYVVNDNQVSTYQIYTTISSDSNGNYVITWDDGRNGDSDVYAQCYLSDGTPVGVNFKVNDDMGNAWQVGPSISKCRNGNFVIAWRDDRNGNNDIYTQRFLSDGTPLDTNFKVNDDEGSSVQEFPSISLDGSGNFVITWEDYRNEWQGDIYAQRYSSDGNPLGTNFKINDDIGNAYQNSPSISTDYNGNFVTTWTDDRDPLDPPYNFDIYAQRYLSDGTPMGINFRINDDEGKAAQNYQSICVTYNGNFVITWADGREYNSNWPEFHDIFAQRYLSDGTPVGANFKVNDDDGNSWKSSTSISTDNSGNFVITWTANNEVYAQRYSSDGIPLGINFKVNVDQTYSLRPNVSVGGNGNFIITWNRLLNGIHDIYAQRYSGDGMALGSNFKVNDESLENYPLGHSISADNVGNFVITWGETQNPYFPLNCDVYAQRYLSDGSRLGDNFFITNTIEESQYAPSVKLWNGTIYNTWTDNRAGGTSYDIWANVLDWNNPVGISDKDLSKVPSEFYLNQNFPNPFNPSTKINYQLPEGSDVTLKIFNALGEEVATLVNNEYKNAGEHSSLFIVNSALPSGVYFYQLRAVDPSTGSGQVFISTKKMILLK